MARTRRTRRRRKPRELTYRTRPENERYFHDMAERLIGQPVVIRMPKDDRYQRGYLVSVGKPGEDRFRVKWTHKGLGRNLKGLWRVHNARLFSNGKYPRPTGKPLPLSACITPVNGVSSVTSTNHNPTRRGSSMAKSATKSKGTKRGRPSVLDDLTDAQRTKLANRVLKLREKGVAWDGPDGICEQVGISSAVVGRKLLKEAGGEDMIRERTVNGGAKATKASTKKSAPKGKAKPAAKSGAKKGGRVVVRRGSGKGRRDPS